METPDLARDSQETEFVAQLCRGDKAALEQLYLRYIDRLYSFVFHQVDRDKSVAEDIVHDTFTAVLKSIGGFNGRSKFYTWLCAIAHHKIADFYRQRVQRDEHDQPPSSLTAIDIEQIAESEPTILSKIESHETQQVVEQALSRLPLDYRQVLIFKYVEQMSVSEVSLIMRRSPKSVEGLLARARKTLRATLVKSGEG